MAKKDEEIQSLKSQLITMSHLRTQLAESQVEIASLLQERAKWAKFCGNEEAGDPVTMSRALASERLLVADLKERMGIEKAEKAGREAYIQRLEKEVSSHL